MAGRGRGKSSGTAGAGGLSGELDAAFAIVQTASQNLSEEGARNSARVLVKKLSAEVKSALLQEDRTEAEKRLLEAKLRALLGAADRISRL